MELHPEKLSRGRVGRVVQRELGILEDGVVTLDKTTSQRAWLRLEKKVTICGRRMRSTHLPHVYVEWSEQQRVQGTTKRYAAPPEERKLESMRLEWSYLRGRDDYLLRRNIQDTTAEGCCVIPRPAVSFPARLCSGEDLLSWFSH